MDGTLEAGFARRDISLFEPEMTMMGWGVRTNRARGVAVPLYARAVVLRDGDTRVAFVAIDTLLVTQGLWYGVLDALAREPELGLDAHNVILVATHTHSGPSGFGHHFWTNLNAPGFAPRVYDGLRDAIVGAIRDGARAAVPVSASLVQATIPTLEGIAFNRSWFAYNRNVDVTPVSEAQRDEATDRTLTALRLRGHDGRLVGIVSWFALHGTTVHANNTQLHPDHKGLVALALEREGLGMVFAQECCGDVSPNYRWDPKRRHTVGRYDDDLKSAEHVADIQLSWLRRLLDAPGTPLVGPLQVATRFVDFARAQADARFTHDRRPHRTTPPELGLSMAEGTAEGPGPLRNLRFLTRGLARVAKVVRGDAKVPFIDLARGRNGTLAGLWPLRHTPPLDPVFAWVRRAMHNQGVHAGPWVPEVVPLNLVTLGAFALVAAPFEMTTVSGRRVRAALRAALPHLEHVVVSPYANAYVGYLTTFEEYNVQHYEAGYTLFGAHSLAALITELVALARDLPDVPLTGPNPPRVDLEPLANITFERAWSA